MRIDKGLIPISDSCKLEFIRGMTQLMIAALKLIFLFRSLIIWKKKITGLLTSVK